MRSVKMKAEEVQIKIAISELYYRQMLTKTMNRKKEIKTGTWKFQPLKTQSGEKKELTVLNGLITGIQ